MIAVDTNILIYAHREDSPFYDIASRRLIEFVETGLGDSLAMRA